MEARIGCKLYFYAPEDHEALMTGTERMPVRRIHVDLNAARKRGDDAP
jgi:hypothetical protein